MTDIKDRMVDRQNDRRAYRDALASIATLNAVAALLAVDEPNLGKWSRITDSLSIVLAESDTTGWELDRIVLVAEQEVCAELATA